MMNIGAILILLRPEMKSTFHHTLIALAIVDILFLLTLIIDSQVARGKISSLEPISKSKISFQELFLLLLPFSIRYHVINLDGTSS